jgi:uncharacterized membrane protein
MQTKNNRFVRIATIAFALTVLTGYVVYSQRQQARFVIRASLSAATNGTAARTAAGPSTNPAPAQKAVMIAPGSKVMAPILDIHRGNSGLIAPGSKSAAVFDLRDRTKSAQPKAPAFARPSGAATNPITAKFQTQSSSPQSLNLPTR